MLIPLVSSYGGVLFPALLFCNFGLWTLAPFVQLVERFRRFASFSVHCELDIKAAVVVSAELDKDERVTTGVNYNSNNERVRCFCSLAAAASQ